MSDSQGPRVYSQENRKLVVFLAHILNPCHGVYNEQTRVIFYQDLPFIIIISKDLGLSCKNKSVFQKSFCSNWTNHFEKCRGKKLPFKPLTLEDKFCIPLD